MRYEDLIYVRDYIEDLKKCCADDEDNRKFIDAIMSVLDYADGEYVNHCEEIGRIAIEDIERMKEDWLMYSVNWLKDCLPNIEYITNASAFRQDKKRFIESYKKYMADK